MRVLTPLLATLSIIGTGPASEIEVSVVPVHSHIAELEPLQFELVVRNVSGAHLESVAEPATLASTRVLVRREGDEEWNVAYVPYYFRHYFDGPPTQPTRMRDRSESRHVLCIALTMDDSDSVSGPCFPRPGSYELQVEYEWREGRIARTDLVAIEVGRATGPDREATDYLKSLEYPHLLFRPLFADTGFDGLPSGAPISREVATTILDEYPRSSYAPWAKFCMARWEGRERYVRENGVMVRRQVPEAMRMARKLVDDDSVDIRLRRISADYLRTLGATDVPDPRVQKPIPVPTNVREERIDEGDTDAAGDVATDVAAEPRPNTSTITLVAVLAVAVTALLLLLRRSS